MELGAIFFRERYGRFFKSIATVLEFIGIGVAEGCFCHVDGAEYFTQTQTDISPMEMEIERFSQSKTLRFVLIFGV